MFRKLFALEVAALSYNNETDGRTERTQADVVSSIREVFTPRTGDYGSMWSMRSFG